MEAWSTCALAQFVVVWQSSQVLPLAIWFAGLPSAMLLLWQLEQLPVTAAWSTRVTGLKRVVEWQSSHVFDVWI